MFSSEPLSEIFNNWKEAIVNDMTASDNAELRRIIKDRFSKSIDINNMTGNFINTFNLLGNTSFVPLKITKLPEEKELFLSRFASDRIVDSIEKDLLHVASEILSTEGDSYHAIYKFNYEISRLKSYLDDASSSPMDFLDLLYGSTIYIFHLAESLIK